MSTPDTLRAARAYAARGLGSFPLNGKIPAISKENGGNGLYDATTDDEQLTEWFTSTYTNIGVAIPEGVYVVDVDVQHDGHTVFRMLNDKHGPEWMLDAPRQRTGQKGLHLWFKHDGPLLEYVVPEAPGIELGRVGRYVVVAPSISPVTKRTYEWEVGLPKDLNDLPEMPDWLVELFTDASEPVPAGERREYDGTDELDRAAHAYTSWPELLGKHGWTLVHGDGYENGSLFRHPEASADVSASLKNSVLFVYSPNTCFPQTTAGRPKGVTLYRALMMLECRGDKTVTSKLLRDAGHLEPLPSLDVWDIFERPAVASEPDGDPANPEPGAKLRLGSPLDWAEAFSADEDTENRWLIEPLIAIGRSHALFAPAKVGKSLLMLAACAALASGRPFLDMPAHDPVPVLYADYEMTRDDVVERLRDFGYGPEDLALLHYFLLPSGNGLDTLQGGAELVHDARLLDARLVVVDTTARAVAGAEDLSDTLRAFARFTGNPLKRCGIAVSRLDHAGKDVSKGQRGTSAKNDDVDVVWKLTVVESDKDGRPVKFDVEATHQRMGWVERKVPLNFTEEPKTGTYRWARRSTGEKVYEPGASDCAADLEALGAPFDITVVKAQKLLQAAEKGRRTKVVSDAIKWRIESADPYLNHTVREPVSEPVRNSSDSRETPRETPSEKTARETLAETFGNVVEEA